MDQANEPAGSGDARKVVTVLFSDVVGSSLLGQELDPESVRQMMTRYFREMKSVLERHGGSVEKFIGDAVLAVFGVPQLHEDDAIRAIRAAVEMREELRKLNEGFEQTWGITLATRTAVNTGEVVAGDPVRGESFVVGDPVNLAARLEQSAQPGETVIGEATYRLVRDFVVAERVGPLSLKGRPEPVYAWRLLELLAGGPSWARRLDSPLVDRESEVASLHEIFGRMVAAGSCQLVTLIGSAGVGKSRLAADFQSMLGGQATFIKGRCLPYGEGITFWPIVGVLRDAAGISLQDSPQEAREKIAELLPAVEDAALVGDRLAALLGLEDATPGIQETFWAVRRLFEHLASALPLVVLLDDIQWGETTFLDLLEYLADWIRRAPVLILCLARPELLEVRSAWMTGKPNATSITLPALTEKESEGLITNLVGGADLAREVRAQIAEVAEGNPLFVEETLRMLVDDGLLRPIEGRWTAAGDLSHISIPPTIQALLTARLDRLESEERAVIQRASVVGRGFWWGAVSELSPEELRPRVGRHLQSLMRKELILPDFTDVRQEDAFRFAHILIRDAAYQGIPKAVRAELHEQLTHWFEARMKDRAGEYEEILGYHLEQAYSSLLELGPGTERTEALGRRASVPLASAGRRALARGDMPAAVNLLSRAAAVLSEKDAQRLELLPQLAFALLETGDFSNLQTIVAETNEMATASGDPRMQAQALILELWMRMFTSPEGWAEKGEREAMRAIAVFERLGDERGLAKAWALLGQVHLYKIQFARGEEAWENAAAHANRAGDHRDEMESLSWVALCVCCGPTPAEQGLQRCQELLERGRGDRKAMSTALFVQADLEAALGRFEEARQHIAEAKALLQEVAATVWMAGPLAQFAGLVELWAGDPVAAERELRWGYEALSAIGEMGWLPTVVDILSEALYAQGRYDEAAALTRESEQIAGTEDLYSQVFRRMVRARVLARRGEVEDAERLAREAVDIGKATDFLQLRARAHLALGEVLLQVSGRTQEAEVVVAEAVGLFEQKGFSVGAERARRLLEDWNDAQRVRGP
ncbi:MAG TPA: adenylate/guanylate cyclase domain-containing protein [Actinomycetota bacterium]|nr:adenylate/guanylate cyclase domain-containing protein [Actinomycetota bacterium]